VATPIFVCAFVAAGWERAEARRPPCQAPEERREHIRQPRGGGKVSLEPPEPPSTPTRAETQHARRTQKLARWTHTHTHTHTSELTQCVPVKHALARRKRRAPHASARVHQHPHTHTGGHQLTPHTACRDVHSPERAGPLTDAFTADGRTHPSVDLSRGAGTKGRRAQPRRAGPAPGRPAAAVTETRQWRDVGGWTHL
jgi:hypothetical protein